MQPAATKSFRAVLCALAVAVAIAGAASCDAIRPRSGLEKLAATPLSTASYPWYIVHSVLVGGRELSLRDPSSKASVNAVDHLTKERELTDRNGRHISSPYREDGLPRFPRTDGQYVGEGHPNQFLAALTGVGVPLSQPVELREGGHYTLADVLENAKRSLSPARILVEPPASGFEDHELGWSIGTIADTLGSDIEWTNKWGESVSLESLVEIALQRPIGWGSCAGTHELYGLARAFNAHRRMHGEATGIWARVARHLDDARARAQAAQHADGSFDYDWHLTQPRGPQPDLGLNKKVHVTGHMLEWLALASPPDEIEAPYLRKAYDFLERCRFRAVSLEPGGREQNEISYGPLTHAVHGMQLYRKKVEARRESTGHAG